MHNQREKTREFQSQQIGMRGTTNSAHSDGQRKRLDNFKTETEDNVSAVIEKFASYTLNDECGFDGI